jgi:tetrachlorobenzoquinone reductase
MVLAGVTVQPPRATARCEHRLRVAAAEPAAQDVLLLRFEDPCGAELPPWQAGDHLELVLPSSLIRHYSLCGRLDERGSYTVAVLRVGDGRGGSIEIHDSDLVGTEMLVRGPRSNFPLVDAPSYQLLAGGIGITPLFAMAQSLARAGADWTLVYGARSAEAMAFRPELEQLGRDRVRFVAQDTQGIPDFASILDASPAGTAVYCCGPEAMIGHVEQLCAERSGRLSLYVERFGGPGSVAEPDGTDRPFELELAETGVTLTVPADKTALEMVHQVLPDHPYSCLGGQCGSCEVAVLSGEVDYRDEVLSDEEHEANSAMMLCVSRARSQRLVIQL